MSSSAVVGFPGVLAPGIYHDISVAEVETLDSSIRLVDVREPEEFEGELGHLSRAELMPLSSFPEAAAHWSKTAPVVLICRSGNRSSMVASQLAQLGFSNLANLVGGMLRVRAEDK